MNRLQFTQPHLYAVTMRNSNSHQQAIEVRESSPVVGLVLVTLTLLAAVPLWMSGQRAVSIARIVGTVVLTFMFSSITLVVREGRVRVLLGGVIPVKSAALADVGDVRRVRPPKWAGLGIRLLKETRHLYP